MVKSTHPDRYLVDYAGDSLAGPVRESVENHLAECAECGTAVRAIRAVRERALSAAREARPRVGLGEGEGAGVGGGGMGGGMAPDHDVLPPDERKAEAPDASSAESSATPSLGGTNDGTDDYVGDVALGYLGDDRPRVTSESGQGPRYSGVHPSTARVADFFYGALKNDDRDELAAHVAVCDECANAIAMFAYSDTAFQTVRDRPQESLGDSAWKLIREWQATPVAMLREEAEVVSGELLARLMELLRDNRESIRALSQRAIQEAGPVTEGRGLVPAVVVDDRGRLRDVQMLERIEAGPGQEILRLHQPNRNYDNASLHAISATGPTPMVSTARIDQGVARIECGPGAEQPLSVDYFIVER